MLARNAWRPEFGSRIAFADLGGRQQRWTGDRTEFLGRNGGPDYPAALAGDTALSNRTGAGMDPCAVLQTQFDLAPNASTEIVFVLGEAATRAEAVALVMRYRSADLDAALKEVEQEWDDILGTVQVKTPDASMDVMLNRWLLYQALACRIVARSAFYQAGGAYGFRDQLQDGMAMAVPGPPWSASISCAPPPGSSSRATISIGGCPMPARACGRESPTIASGCPMRSPITSRSPAISPSSTRRFRFWKARAAAGRERVLFPAHGGR
jgi:Cellobiose phosphorylase